jgi:O-antigen/teichoic acid export membrane protein
MQRIKKSVTNIQNSIRYNERTRQALYLFLVNFIGMPLGIITSIIITRFLGAKGFGDYQFIMNILTLAILIFSFGLFQAGNRALVLNNDKQIAREYYGTELVFAGLISLTTSLFLVFFSLIDKNIQEKGLDVFFLYIIPFNWIFILTNYFEVLFQADNRIKLLGITRLYPKIGFLVSALLVYFFFMETQTNRLGLIYTFYLSTLFIVYFYVVLKIRVSFRNLKQRIREIWIHLREFGFNVYIGSVIAIGLIHLTGILISYFGIDNSGVGFYSLALTLTLPLSFIPNTIATTHYKDFSLSNKVPGKLVLITLGLSVFALFMLWIIVGPFINYFYGKEFIKVIELTYIVSIGVVAHGLADFFNRFLGANGQGKALRNSAIIVGICFLALNLILIPKLNEKGAAYSKMIGGFIYLANIIVYYIKFTRKNPK